MLLLPNLPYNWIIAVVVGSIVGFTVSIIFLRDERLEIGGSIMAAREGRAPKGRDAEEEDALLDEAEDAPADEEAAEDDEPEAEAAPESDR
jgi:hypothetical protein